MRPARPRPSPPPRRDRRPTGSARCAATAPWLASVGPSAAVGGAIWAPVGVGGREACRAPEASRTPAARPPPKERASGRGPSALTSVWGRMEDPVAGKEGPVGYGQGGEVEGDGSGQGGARPGHGPVPGSGEQRGAGEAQLVDQPGLEQAGEEQRSALADHPVVAEPAELVDGLGEVDGVV